MRVIELLNGRVATIGLVTGCVVEQFTGNTYLYQLSTEAIPLAVLYIIVSNVFVIPVIKSGGITEEENQQELNMSRLAMLLMCILFGMELL